VSLVAEAANGRDAVQQYREHRPDITLMDLQMPEMNGLDALTTIRGEFPDARIIVLTTYTGDVQVLRTAARASLHYRKATQPLATPSAGCIFQNPRVGEVVPDGIPRSAGALVDRAGLKGRRQGGARISDHHANFIVNDGGATAADIRTLIELARETVRDRFGVVLRDEVVYLGKF